MSEIEEIRKRLAISEIAGMDFIAIDSMLRELEAELSKQSDDSKVLDWERFEIKECDYCHDGVYTEYVSGQKHEFPCGNCSAIGYIIVQKDVDREKLEKECNF